MPTSTAQGSSQVRTLTPQGASSRWLGALGHINGLTWDHIYPGGANQMSCTVAQPPQWRTDALNPGRLVEIWRGASRVWHGILDEPVPDTTGWSVTAHGAGTYGNSFMADYTTWTIDNVINRAIARGLPWTNVGIGSLGFMQTVAEDASLTVTDFLNNATIQAGLLWNIDSRQGNLLTVQPPPSTNTPDRILVCTVPNPRTLAAGLNSLWYTYVSAQTGSTQTDTTSLVSNAAAILIHGNQEQQVDMTPAGLMTAAAAKAAAQNILNQYISANYAQAFNVYKGQYLTIGGSPIDLGTETAYPHVARLILTDGSYGGEVVQTPVTFVVGDYSYDDDSQMAAVTPYQSYKTDLQTLLTAVVPKLRQ
jgi:hypothetical protein